MDELPPARAGEIPPQIMEDSNGHHHHQIPLHGRDDGHPRTKLMTHWEKEDAGEAELLGKRTRERV